MFKLSELARDVAEKLRIEDEDRRTFQAFMYALEDGEVCEQLGNLGYSQEDIESVHDELMNGLEKKFSK